MKVNVTLTKGLKVNVTLPKGKEMKVNVTLPKGGGGGVEGKCHIT